MHRNFFISSTDAHDKLFMEVDTSKCTVTNGCDPLAFCGCGTVSGEYQCVCPTGYYGTGIPGHCYREFSLCPFSLMLSLIYIYIYIYIYPGSQRYNNNLNSSQRTMIKEMLEKRSLGFHIERFTFKGVHHA